MAHKVTTPGVEDVASVGTRISWGAIFAGALLALAIQFLLGILGGAVGVSVGDRVRTDNLWTGALIWVIVTTCASLFVGGLVTSLFTVGENKVEAVLYGIIMWALMVSALVGLGATGVRAGISGLVQVINTAQTASGESWTEAAKSRGSTRKPSWNCKSRCPARQRRSKARSRKFRTPIPRRRLRRRARRPPGIPSGASGSRCWPPRRGHGSARDRRFVW